MTATTIEWIMMGSLEILGFVFTVLVITLVMTDGHDDDDGEVWDE